MHQGREVAFKFRLILDIERNILQTVGGDTQPRNNPIGSLPFSAPERGDRSKGECAAVIPEATALLKGDKQWRRNRHLSYQLIMSAGLRRNARLECTEVDTWAPDLPLHIRGGNRCRILIMLRIQIWCAGKTCQRHPNRSQLPQTTHLPPSTRMQSRILRIPVDSMHFIRVKCRLLFRNPAGAGGLWFIRDPPGLMPSGVNQAISSCPHEH